jgi:hypothetical protein
MLNGYALPQFADRKLKEDLRVLKLIWMMGTFSEGVWKDS